MCHSVWGGAGTFPGSWMLQVEARGGRARNCGSGRGRLCLGWLGSWKQKTPRERGVVPSCLAASTLSFSLQGGAAFSPAILALILCTIIVRAPPGQAEGVRA